jgi:hypothetical protein
MSLKKSNPLLNRKIISILLIGITLSACVSTNNTAENEPPQTPVETKKEILYSVAPISKPSNIDVLFAQKALKTIGYKIGLVDGIWGERSANALIAFERVNDLWSADGYLSELNLHTLEIKSGLSRLRFNEENKVKNRSVDKLLNKRISLENGPQLIILERSYQMMGKPNPYSSKLMHLTPGTGIYIIAKQDGWYKIESLERQSGFIKVD